MFNHGESLYNSSAFFYHEWDEWTNKTNRRIRRMKKRRGLEMRQEIIYPDLSYQIMQAVFEVHNQLGPGFLERIYENALAHELEIMALPASNPSASPTKKSI